MSLRKYVVVPPMKGGLENLRQIASNLWFSWHTEAVDLFDHLDERLWRETSHNPQQVLIRLSRSRLNEVLEDEGYLAHAEKVCQRFQAYLSRVRPYDYNLPKPVDFTTAYFSLEFGLAECLPIYSGGLGLLAGDHLKSASDLNLPLVGVGLMYQEGYFSQRLSVAGWQEEVFNRLELDTLPVEKLTDETGQLIRVSVELADETLWARVLKVNVGRVPLYLLDTDIPENPPALRATTARLYGGDMEMRVRQEVLLGVGGCRALAALGTQPAVYHLNEGHAAFVLLERMRRYVEEMGLSFEEAREMVTSQSVLTIHTPVPAGNDVFDRGLMQKYFSNFAKRLGIEIETLLGLGRRAPSDPNEGFCMPVLGLRLTAQANGVSRLHARVTRTMWRDVWPRTDIEDVPISPITNGVHIPSYISRDLVVLYDRYLGPGWSEDPDNEKVWRRINTMPDMELWRTHERCRTRLVHFARRRLARQLQNRGASASAIAHAQEVLDPEALTICFARRFATYKRATLLFRESERLGAILSRADRPVQLIFAGKAHPADDRGKELIRAIVDLAREGPFRDRLVFLEDYDINIARYMVQGADVWLNTPRRPLEACGTSGMKAAANGALNLSILDGWWDEAYLGDNGWAIGWGEEYTDAPGQDIIESLALYDLLEESVAPLFYERGVDDMPREWIRMMKRSIGSICPIFNSHRMVSDYIHGFYVPQAQNSMQLRENHFQVLKEMVAWKKKMGQDWSKISIMNVEVGNDGTAVKGKEVEVFVTVDTSGHHPLDFRVEVLHGPLDQWDNLKVRRFTRLEPDDANSHNEGGVVFSGFIPLEYTGLYGFEVRVTPDHPNLAWSHRFQLVRRA